MAVPSPMTVLHPEGPPQIRKRKAIPFKNAEKALSRCLTRDLQTGSKHNPFPENRQRKPQPDSPRHHRPRHVCTRGDSHGLLEGA